MNSKSIHHSFLSCILVRIRLFANENISHSIIFINKYFKMTFKSQDTKSSYRMNK